MKLPPILLAAFVLLLVGCGDDGPTASAPVWHDIRYEVETSLSSSAPAQVEYIDSTGGLSIEGARVPTVIFSQAQDGSLVSLRVIWNWTGISGALVIVTIYVDDKEWKSNSATGLSGNLVVQGNL